jgi:hypothetical protein
VGGLRLGAKLKLHAAKAGGIYQGSGRFAVRAKLKLHAAKAGGTYQGSGRFAVRAKLKLHAAKAGGICQRPGSLQAEARGGHSPGMIERSVGLANARSAKPLALLIRTMV